MKRKLKILFTMTPAFNPNDGGVQRTTFKLGKKFTELGHEVYYFSMSNVGNIEAEYGTLFYAQFDDGCQNKNNILELEKSLFKIKPDIVINQMPYEFQMSELLAATKIKLDFVLLGCLRNSLFSVKNNVRDTAKIVLPRAIFSIFNNKIGLYLLLQAHRLKHRKQLKKILDLHDKFVLLAPPNNEELKYFVGRYKQHKVEVVPNSIPSVFDGELNKEKMIVHVGRLNDKQKRSDLLLPIWERVAEKLTDWEFVVVGDGPYADSMKKDIENKKLPRVKMLGYQKPEDWYRKAAIFIMTSSYEGFPNVLLEAQSFGCVTLAFESYDALSAIVTHNVDALLIPPYDVEIFSQELMRLASDPVRINTMQQASKENAKKYVIDSVGEIWEDLFAKVL